MNNLIANNFADSLTKRELKEILPATFSVPSIRKINQVHPSELFRLRRIEFYQSPYVLCFRPSKPISKTIQLT